MPEPRAPFRADLEALRGVAVLLVVAYHAGVSALAGGFVGVDVFFVLSGYFTTRALARQFAATGTVDLVAFYGRRALRLLPALLVVVAATLAAAWALYAPIDRAAVAATARSVALGTANNAFAREAVDYFAGADSPFLHTWSLAVEEQVSLFGPLLFLAMATVGGWTATSRDGAQGTADESARRAAGLLRGAVVGLALTGAISLVAALRLTSTSPSWAFFGAAARAWEFVAGGMLALTLPTDAPAPAAAADQSRGAGWWLQVAGLLAIVGAATAYDRAMPYPGTAALLPVLGAAAVVAGGVRGRGILSREGGGAATLRWLGRLSYSWYLWHWPVVVIATELFPTLGTWGRLALSAGALAPAWLTHHWIERPARAAGATGSATRVTAWPAMAVAGCMAVALVAGGMERAAEHRTRASDQRAFAAARLDRMPHGCWARDASVQARGKASDTCVFGDVTAATTVALFGDSHAEHWLAAFDRLGRERGWRVVLLVKGGCPVADAPELASPRSARRDDECARYREAAVRRIIALRPAVAVLSSFDEYVTRDPEPAAARVSGGRVSPQAWRRGLRRTYARLAAAGVPVVALRGTPHPGFDVPSCLSRRAAGGPLARPCVYERDDALHAAARSAQLAAVRDVAASGLPVRAVDMVDQICPSSPCGVVRQGRVVFTDDNHLTASFTRASSGVVGARLDGAARELGVRVP